MKKPITFVGILLLVSILILLAACAGQQETLPPPSADTTFVEPEQMVTVQVAIENLRATPNGTKIGETTSGSQYVLVERRANWVQVRDGVRNAWIWAPSVGFAQVNPLDISTWIGSQETRAVSGVTEIFGPPDQVEDMGGDLFEYFYYNVDETREGTLFGTNSFLSVEITVDRVSRQVLGIVYEFPPFTGSVKDLLRTVGLPDVRSTKTDFSHAIFRDKFAGIPYLEAQFKDSDFNQITSLYAMRYALDSFMTDLVSGEKKIVHDGNQLILSMEVRNVSSNFGYAGLGVDVELQQGDLWVGGWTIDAIDIRIEPGVTELIFQPLPISDAEVDVNQLAAKAEIYMASPVPAGVVFQP